MNRHLHRPCELHNFGCVLDIHIPFATEDAKDYTSCAQLLDVHNVLPHDIEFGRAAHKVPSPRSYEHIDRQTPPLDRTRNQPAAGGDSTLTESRAEFDSVSSAISCCETRLDCLGAQFEDHLLHWSDLVPSTRRNFHTSEGMLLPRLSTCSRDRKLRTAEA